MYKDRFDGNVTNTGDTMIMVVSNRRYISGQDHQIHSSKRCRLCFNLRRPVLASPEDSRTRGL
jgi:hypothetical protein